LRGTKRKNCQSSSDSPKGENAGKEIICPFPKKPKIDWAIRKREEKLKKKKFRQAITREKRFKTYIIKPKARKLVVMVTTSMASRRPIVAKRLMV